MKQGVAAASTETGGRFRVHVGDPISAPELAHLDRPRMTRHLQDLTWSPRHAG
jgi:hypothetical protein